MRPLRRYRALRFAKHSFAYPPLVHEDDVYLGDSSRTTVRLKRPAYDVIWTRPSEGFAYKDVCGHVLIGSLPGAGGYQALSTADGSVRWTRRLGGVPIVLGQSLFVATEDGDVVQVDPLSGNDVSTTRISDGPLTVFAIAGHCLLIARRDTRHALADPVACYDGRARQVLWVGGLFDTAGSATRTHPWGERQRYLYSDDKWILVRRGFEVVAFSTATGAERWRSVVPMIPYPLPVVAFGRVFLVGGPTMTSITCLRLSDGEVEWSREMESSRPSGFGPAHQGAATLICLGGVLLFLAPQSGEEVGRYDGPEVGGFGVAAAGEDLLLSTQHGRIHVARPVVGGRGPAGYPRAAGRNTSRNL
jgi:outer membrane protein assembly factor BamB